MLAKDSEFVDYLVALLFVDFRIKRRLDSRVGMRGWWLETHAADIEIFLEAIQLEEVGEFQSADISALCTDFLLKGRYEFRKQPEAPPMWTKSCGNWLKSGSEPAV